MTDTEEFEQLPEALPPSLDTGDFREAWAEWLAHRAEDLKDPMTARGKRMLLKRLSKWDAARAIAAIEHSISGKWKSVYEAPAVAKPKAPSLWEIKEREKALRDELDAVSSRYAGPDAERINAMRMDKRARILAQLKALRAQKLQLKQ